MFHFREMEGIALRYWSTDKGGIVEHVLHIEEAGTARDNREDVR